MAEAGNQNSIELVLRAVDQMSAILVQVENRLEAVEKSVKGTKDASDKLTSGWVQAG